MFIELDKERNGFVLHNNGLPPPILTSCDGQSRHLGEGNCPLGLYEDLETSIESVPDAQGASLLCFSDGLEDFARAQRVSMLSLACRLHFSTDAVREELLVDADDDVMLVRVCLKGCEGESFFPVMMESYPGDSARDIDDIEDSWARSISYAIPEIPEDKLYALLLTAREALLNAMNHGCSGKPEHKAEVHVHYSKITHTVRLMIADSGDGYFDDFLTNPDPDMEVERHSGLVLIRNFPDKIWTERNNATVFADFLWI